jgi:hypothetical protein
MKIGLITTLNTNIGDDFIREGILLVLKNVFRRQRIELVLINKHHPLTVYPPGPLLNLANRSSKFPGIRSLSSPLIEILSSRQTASRFDECDLIVQCGAPVFWPNCHKSEWAVPLWHHVVARLYEKIPVLNLAAGSCYPWEQQPAFVENRRDVEYLRAILGYCRITTVRDVIAKNLSISMGMETELIPCSALLAAGRVINSARRTIFINYMPGGGHYDWGQKIDSNKWCLTVRALLTTLRKHHQVAFLCHNEAEYNHARALDPSISRIFPRNIQEYCSMVSNAEAAICNRMHASVGLAGMGVPSIAVGTDTRLLMVEAIGQPVLYVKDATPERLINEVEGLLAKKHKERERLAALRTDVFNRYVEAVASAI